MSSTTCHSRNYRRWLALVICVALLASAAFGCQSDELSESESQLVRDIFRSGLEMEPDPFVRAETLRALKLSDDPRLAQHAEELTRDGDAMVRVAALRTLAAAEHPDLNNRAAHLFNRGSEDEQFHILDLAIKKGDEELRESIIESAHNTNTTRLRRHALQQGLIAEVEAADETERDDLLTELGRFVLDDDAEIAGLALRVLIEYGQGERADRFLERLDDKSGSQQDQIHAAQVLATARAEAGRDGLLAVVAEAEADDPDELGIPQGPSDVDEDLLRWAILGLAAIGEDDFVHPAQRYLRDADTDSIVEVLDALSANPSPDATLSLRNRLRDQAPVGYRALELYTTRDDARVTSVIQATSHRDYQTRRLAASLLVEHFSDSWIAHLEEQLGYSDPAGVKATLRLLQTLLASDDQLQIVEALEEPLHQLATGQGQEFVRDDTDDEDLAAVAHIISTLAADLLFRLGNDTTYADIIADHPDRQTLYIHLEYMATHQPGEHTDRLRQYLRDDSFARRLMAATGLWKAMGSDVDLHLLEWVIEDDE